MWPAYGGQGSAQVCQCVRRIQAQYMNNQSVNQLIKKKKNNSNHQFQRSISTLTDAVRRVVWIEFERLTRQFSSFSLPPLSCPSAREPAFVSQSAGAGAGKGFSDVLSAPFRSDPPLPIAASACDCILPLPNLTLSWRHPLPKLYQHSHLLALHRHRNAILLN